MSAIAFKISHRDVAARTAVLSTLHGQLRTPAFMPVGTLAAVKGLCSDWLREAGCDMLLANTYHLMLRPGEQVVKQLGGLHRFMAWSGPILTDSGGYQVFSLAKISRLDDDGVVFANHVDGSAVALNPQRVVEVQNQLGADLIMVLDDCPALPSTPERLKQAVGRTVHWAAACRQSHQRNDEQALLAIVQGGLDADLRAVCARQLVEMDFPGYAIGGLSVGETHAQMVATLSTTASLLPADRPRYLMGVGMPRDILAAIALGVDLFDCVLPTRNGRNAYAFTRHGPVRLRNRQYQLDERPLQAGCKCPACRSYSRAYLRHLFVCREMLGPVLVSAHNVWFYQDMLAQARQAISQQRFVPFTEAFLAAIEPPQQSEVEL